MGHTYTNILLHIIFSTKDRTPTLADADMRSRMHGYLGGIVRELNGIPLSINGPADHVHALVTAPATQAVADFVRVLKTNSSRWAHYEAGLADFAWQTGYGAFSVSQSGKDQVCHYIAGQEQHHRTMTFQEEFVAFLKRHGIDYDERYIWE